MARKPPCLQEDSPAKETSIGKTTATTVVPVLTSCRWVTSYICCLGMLLIFAIRVNIAMALICMFPKSKEGIDESKDEFNSSDFNNISGNSTTGNGNTTMVSPWDDKAQGLALSAYNYGYLVSPILAGYIATKSSKFILAVSMTLSGIATVATPWAVNGSVYITVILRVVVGMCGGVYEPSMQHLVSLWAPKQERGKVTALTQSGKVAGNVLSFTLSGVLCKVSFLGGWPLVFYGTGALCLVWAMLVLALIYDRPDDHPRISIVEREYIKKSLPMNSKADTKDVKKARRMPWFKIVTSLPFLACIIIKLSGSWVFNVQSLNQPMWIRDILKFDVSKNGIFSALPYVGQFVGSLLTGVILDLLTHTTYSTTAVRKTTFLLCLLVPASIIFSLAFMTETQRTLAICLTVVTPTVYSAVPISLRLVIIEMAPKYTGILMGIIVSVGSIPGMVAPLVTSITTHDGSATGWREVFFICAGFYAGAGIFFLLFGSSVEQPWAMDLDEIVVNDTDIANSESSEKAPTDTQFDNQGFEDEDEPARNKISRTERTSNDGWKVSLIKR